MVEISTVQHHSADEGSAEKAEDSEVLPRTPAGSRRGMFLHVFHDTVIIQHIFLSTGSGIKTVFSGPLFTAYKYINLIAWPLNIFP